MEEKADGGTRFRVQVQRNGGPQQGGKVVLVTEGQAYALVLDAVATKLGLDRATVKLFTAEGGLVEDTDELCPDDFLYAAHQGEAFGYPTSNQARDDSATGAAKEPEVVPEVEQENVAPAPETNVASASGSSSSSSSSSSLRPPTLYLLSPEAGGQGARPRKKRTTKNKHKKPLSPEELAEAEPEEEETLPPLVDDEQQKTEARKNLRPGGRPLADGCFTVELDLSHFVRVHEERNQKTLMIIVADRSGSMRGRPWRQVQIALMQIMEHIYATEEENSMIVEVVVYNHEATSLALTKETYKDVINQTQASSKTCFASTFDCIRGLMDKYTTKDSNVDKIVVGFMTDGQHTSGKDLRAASIALRDKIKTLNREVVIHAIGFSDDHNFRLLNDLRKLGTKEGVFQYAEAADGEEALLEKIQQLFNLVNSSIGDATITFEFVDSRYSFVDGFSAPVTLRRKCTSVVPIPREGKVELELWLRRDDSAADSAADKGKEADEGNTKVYVLCKVESKEGVLGNKVEVNVEKLSRGGTNDLCLLKYLNQEVNELSKKISDAVSSGKKPAPAPSSPQPQTGGSGGSGGGSDSGGGAQKPGEGKLQQGGATGAATAQKAAATAGMSLVNVSPTEINEWTQQLNNLQLRIDEIMPFHYSKDERERMLQIRSEAQAKLDGLHRILAELSRGAVSTAVIARANDIRFAAVFSKARRQRKMDVRAQKNAKEMQRLEQLLAELETEEEELKDVSEDSKEFFDCMLTQMNWTELLLEDQDVLGVGLAVARPEVSIDDSTQIRIFDISNTFMAKSAMEDAIKYSLDSKDAIRTHGGFEMARKIAVALRGKGREPINAWLPLYIHKAHWERVKILLKPILGYFCTLDPLGYDIKQMDVLFLILGTMIVRLGSEPGEFQLKLLFSFMRLCVEAAKDFRWIDHIRSVVTAFIESPAGRTKDQLPNLLVLVGYLLVVPSHELGLDDDRVWKSFWSAFLEEAMRRSSDSIFYNANEFEVLGLLDVLARGRSYREPVLNSADAVALLAETGKDFSGDKLFKFPFEVPEGAGSAIADEPARYDPRRLVKSMMDATRYFEYRLNETGYPNIDAMLSSITFIRQWLFLQKHYSHDLTNITQQMDDRDGLVPDAWVSFFKDDFAVRLSGVDGAPTLHSMFRHIFKLAPSTVKPPRIRTLTSASGGGGGGGGGDDDGDDDGDDSDKEEEESKKEEEEDKKGKGKGKGDEDEPEEPHYMRAALAQAIRYRSNKKARTAIENKSFLRAFDDPFNVLTDLHDQLEHKREAERAKLELARLARAKNHNYRENMELKKQLLADLRHLHLPAQWNSLTHLPLIMGLFHSAAGPYGQHFSSGEDW